MAAMWLLRVRTLLWRKSSRLSENVPMRMFCLKIDEVQTRWDLVLSRLSASWSFGWGDGVLPASWASFSSGGRSEVNLSERAPE